MKRIRKGLKFCYKKPLVFLLTITVYVVVYGANGNAGLTPTIKNIYEKGGVQNVEIYLPESKVNVVPGSKGKVYYLDDFDNTPSYVADIFVINITEDGIAHARVTGKSHTEEIQEGYLVNFSPGISSENLNEKPPLREKNKKLKEEKDNEVSTYSLIKIAAERGFFVFRELKKLSKVERAMEIAENAERTKMVEKLRHRKAQMAQNIEQAIATYSDSFRELSAFVHEDIEKGFKRYTIFLLEHNAEEQLKVLKTVRNHFNTFSRDKHADKVVWQQDFSNIGK